MHRLALILRALVEIAARAPKKYSSGLRVLSFAILRKLPRHAKGIKSIMTFQQSIRLAAAPPRVDLYFPQFR